VTGLHAVRALVARATGDLQTEFEAVGDFVRTAGAESPSNDLTLGHAGVLVGCALLVDRFVPVDPRLDARGSELLASLVDDVERLPRIIDAFDVSYLGIAHGWAGLLYAALLWCRATDRQVPEAILARLAELAELGEPVAGALRWRRTVGPSEDDLRFRYVAGWCNGTAGMTLLWTLAEQIVGDGRYAELANRAVDYAPLHAESIHQLCCGSTGQAYAALSVHRLTGDESRLTQAQSIAQELRAHEATAAFVDQPYRLSLYKGALGNALLLAELEASPADARMPMFELEDERSA